MPPVLLLLSKVETLSFEDIRVEADVRCCWECDGCGIPPPRLGGFLPVVPLVLSVIVLPRLLLVVEGNEVLPPPLPIESDTVLLSLG